MPYHWINPDVVLSHQGVDIFYIYQDDHADNPVREYWYGFSSICADETDDGAFDIREVEALLPSELQAACRNDHRATLMVLIDQGFLTACGFIIDGYLCDNAQSIREAVEAHTKEAQS
ncbi:MAG: hypothetical protein ACYDBB_04715 [Armatimonadota bacterium]